MTYDYCEHVPEAGDEVLVSYPEGDADTGTLSLPDLHRGYYLVELPGGPRYIVPEAVSHLCADTFDWSKED